MQRSHRADARAQHERAAAGDIDQAFDLVCGGLEVLRVARLGQASGRVQDGLRRIVERAADPELAGLEVDAEPLADEGEVAARGQGCARQDDRRDPEEELLAEDLGEVDWRRRLLAWDEKQPRRFYCMDRFIRL